MTKWIAFLKTTVTGGIVFLVPFVLLVWVLGQAYRAAMVIVRPLSEIIPFKDIGTIAVINLLALLLLVLICFLAELAAKSKYARRLTRFLEDRFLSKIPFYHFIKGATASTVGADGESGLKPVMAQFDDYWQIAFEIERLDAGKVAVYLPSAPEPWSGTICVLKEDRVAPLDMRVMEAIEHFQQLGRGSKLHLDRHFTGGVKAPNRDVQAEQAPVKPHGG